MIGIVNYGVGNLGSLRNALDFLDIPNIVSENPGNLSECHGLILPGVGAFSPAMKKLKALNLDSYLKAWVSKGYPLLGICLGMQLLLTESEEGELHEGLGIISGRVTKMKETPRSVHIGWNLVKPKIFNRLLPFPGYAYFVHSYTCWPVVPDHVIGETTYGSIFPSFIQSGNVIGVQFHPEKSQEFGLQILLRFKDETV